MGGGGEEKKLTRSRTFITSTVHNTGPLIGRGKKVKFPGIFRDKFAEKRPILQISRKIWDKCRRNTIVKKANFAEILYVNFARKQSVLH